MPAYTDESTLTAGAMQGIQWTYPFVVGLPLIDDLIDILFPLPAMPLFPPWTQTIRDKWEQFNNWVKGWFVSNATNKTYNTVAQFTDDLLIACHHAASEGGFALFHLTDGLPSYPQTTPPINPGGV